jgi:hypothetical protein
MSKITCALLVVGIVHVRVGAGLASIGCVVEVVPLLAVVAAGTLQTDQTAVLLADENGGAGVVGKVVAVVAQLALQLGRLSLAFEAGGVQAGAEVALAVVEVELVALNANCASFYPSSVYLRPLAALYLLLGPYRHEK